MPPYATPVRNTKGVGTGGPGGELRILKAGTVKVNTKWSAKANKAREENTNSPWPHPIGEVNMKHAMRLLENHVSFELIGDPRYVSYPKGRTQGAAFATTTFNGIGEKGESKYDLRRIYRVLGQVTVDDDKGAATAEMGGTTTFSNSGDKNIESGDLISFELPDDFQGDPKDLKKWIATRPRVWNAPRGLLFLKTVPLKPETISTNLSNRLKEMVGDSLYTRANSKKNLSLQKKIFRNAYAECEMPRHPTSILENGWRKDAKFVKTLLRMFVVAKELFNDNTSELIKEFGLDTDTPRIQDLKDDKLKRVVNAWCFNSKSPMTDLPDSFQPTSQNMQNQRVKRFHYNNLMGTLAQNLFEQVQEETRHAHVVATSSAPPGHLFDGHWKSYMTR